MGRKKHTNLSKQIKYDMTKDQINDKFFESLFKRQMDQLDTSQSKSEIQEAHEIITKLLFAWEVKMERNLTNDKITQKALDWLSKNSNI